MRTKLDPSQYKNAQRAINESLQKHNLDYIGLMLLHHPGALDITTYEAMGKTIADEKLRFIGLSN